MANIVELQLIYKTPLLMSQLLDFTDSELHLIRQVLVQRYKKDVEIQLADCEIALDKDSEEVTSCPTVFWHAQGANFVVLKAGMFRFRTQFFYTPHEQYDTGIDEYNNLGECVTAVLQIQSDHEREDPSENSDNQI